MTIDLKAPEVQEAIRAAVEEATAPLVAKRDELLADLRKAKKGQQVDPEAHARLEEDNERLKGELAAAQRATKTAQGEADKFKKAAEGTEARLQRTVKDSGLVDALTKAGVTNPVHLKAARALLSDAVQVVAEGEGFTLKGGDKALDAFIGEWAKSDEGKVFVAAPNNTGGGAGGGKGGGSGNGAGVKPNIGGTPQERVAAINARFPELHSN